MRAHRFLAVFGMTLFVACGSPTMSIDTGPGGPDVVEVAGDTSMDVPRLDVATDAPRDTASDVGAPDTRSDASMEAANDAAGDAVIDAPRDVAIETSSDGGSDVVPVDVPVTDVSLDVPADMPATDVVSTDAPACPLGTSVCTPGLCPRSQRCCVEHIGPGGSPCAVCVCLTCACLR